MRAAHHGGGRTLASKGCMTRTETCETRNPRGDRDKKTYEFKDRYGVVTRGSVATYYSQSSIRFALNCVYGDCFALSWEESMNVVSRLRSTTYTWTTRKTERG